MMPPDIAGMMGGAAPQPAAGGLPPEIAAMMGGGEAPVAEEEPLPGVTDGMHGGGEDALVMAIDMIQEAIDGEADQADIQVMLKAQTALQAILAKNQAETDKGLGGAVNPAAIRKQAEAGMGA
jgi:hypothetical protein